MNAMERNYPIRTYVFAGIGLIFVLFVFKSCTGSDPEPSPPAPEPSVSSTPTPTPEPTPTPTETVEPKSPGEEVGEITRDTVDELYQWGSDFVEGFTNPQPTPTP